MDEMTLTLNSPITEEQWDMIEDVDFDHTDSITFYTKHGKEVEFVKRKTGKWIYDGYDKLHSIDWCHCSVCGNPEDAKGVYACVRISPYCSRCGSKMEGDKP